MELMNLVFIALRQLHQALIVCNVPDLWMHTSTSMRMSHARGPRQTDDASTLDTHNPNGRGRRGCVTTESPNPPPVEAVCTPLAHNHRLAPRARAESGAVPFALGGGGGRKVLASGRRGWNRHCLRSSSSWETWAPLSCHVAWGPSYPTGSSLHPQPPQGRHCTGPRAAGSDFLKATRGGS